MKSRAPLTAFAVALSVLPLAATSQDIPDTIVTLEVLPGWQTDAGTRMAGLRLTLAPGWKTYWRSPGDAGIPPQIVWSGARNIAGAALHWPVPEVFEVSGMRSIGYHDQVVVPIELTPVTPGAPQRMAGQFDIGVCEDVCVPARLDFSIDLAGVGQRDPAIVAALIDRPRTAAEAGAGAVTCRIVPDAGGVTVQATIPMPAMAAQEVVVIEAGDPSVWVSEPGVQRQGGTLTAQARMIHVDGGAFAVDRSALRFTVLGDGRAVDITGCTG